MPESESILHLARRLAADSREIAAASQANNETSAAQQRIDEIRVTIAEMKNVQRSLRALRNVGGIDISFGSAIAAEFSRFESNASAGLPSALTIRHADRRLQGIRSRAVEDLLRNWDAWASSRIDELPIAKVAFLEAADRTDVNRSIEQLRQLRRQKPPSLSDISLFKRAHDRILESLDALPDGDDDVLELVERLSLGGIHLADLSTQEVETLRSSAEIARQVTLVWGAS
ncbi:hypothetical protein C6I20_08015 [Aeromicrobium sp. A1-2]|uniref:hypothetical protein n=1 Tax=Aeromicrobium sp. A1-2 TaxID=2107713 RepID=UPI000E4A9542|nr:hypothetical protein [Aeromicrobium sp. A1-2]AXT85132.1 hypothetical protein C6I20_08015 [Aeromicrobium sp. A1-2]